MSTYYYLIISRSSLYCCVLRKAANVPLEYLKRDPVSSGTIGFIVMHVLVKIGSVNPALTAKGTWPIGTDANNSHR